MDELITVDSLRKITTSHSLDNVFDYCPRKFEFLALYDKRPKRDSGFAAEVGTALHEGMQAWLVSREEGDDEETRSRKAFFAFAKHYPWAMELEQVQKTRSFENSCLMLYKMIRSPEWDDWELLYVKDHGWAVEVPFLLTHTSIGPVKLKDLDEWVMLATQGKIDLIMRHKRTGKIRSVDIKTTINPINMIRSNYEFSGQQTGYAHVVHAMAGVTPANFEVVYAICMFSAQDEPRIEFVPIAKSEDDVDDYWLGKIDKLERMKKYAEQGWFPRTNGGCNAWNQECAMFDICHSRDAKLIQRWYDFIDAVPQVGYDYWVQMEV